MPTITDVHRKAEHVFNDIPGSLESIFEASLTLNRARSLLFAGPHGALSSVDLPRTFAMIIDINTKAIEKEARIVVAPPTPVSEAESSLQYRQAKQNLELALSHLVETTANVVWRRKPADSAFHELEPIGFATMTGHSNPQLAMWKAETAFTELLKAAYDPNAERALVARKTSDAKRGQRTRAIQMVKESMRSLEHLGTLLLETFARELEDALDDRIVRA